MRRKRNGITMYIRPEELAQRGYDQTVEGFAAYAREALRGEGMSEYGMTLEVFSGADGIMLFCQPHERSVTRFDDLNRLVRAADGLRELAPARSALWHGEDGQWYLELADESSKLWQPTAAAREYGTAVAALPLWLGEHARCIEAHDAVGLLAALA